MKEVNIIPNAKLPSGGAGGPHNGVRLALAAVQLLRAIAVIFTSHDRPWWWPWT